MRRKDESKQSAKLFSVLVLAGAALAASLPACTNDTPDPKTDGGAKEGGGGKFW